jgi:hypothetical protein
MITAQAKAHEVMQPKPGEAPEQPDPADAMKAKASLMDAETKQQGLHLEAAKIASDTHNQALDREAEAHSDLIDLAKEVIDHQHDAEMAAREVPKVEKEIEGK